MTNCQFCNKETNKRSHKNHERSCKHNPNRQSLKPKTEAWYESMRKRRGNGTNQYTKAKQLGLPKPEYDTSKRTISGCFAWSTEQRSANAKKHNCGGYKENAGRSKKFRVIDSYGKETTLQSSYEFRCSEILNSLGIKWLRPLSLKYDGKNYFADFYLPDLDIWLDPKNDYKAKQDEEKIRKVIEQNGIKLFVILEHQLTEEYIGSLK